jgi:hypothetical protein
MFVVRAMFVKAHLPTPSLAEKACEGFQVEPGRGGMNLFPGEEPYAVPRPDAHNLHVEFDAVINQPNILLNVFVPTSAMLVTAHPPTPSLAE